MLGKMDLMLKKFEERSKEENIENERAKELAR